MTVREPATLETGGSPRRLDAFIESAPDVPAVFRISPAQGSPYLGRTSLLRRRLRRLLAERTAPSRFLNLRDAASRVDYWLIGSRLESALLHYTLARQHFPDSYLKVLKLRMPAFVRVLLANPYPRTQITTRIAGGAGFYYGPFRTRAIAEQFEAQVLDLFQIRRCEDNFEPSPAHPGCIYGEMNKCLRPCQAAVGAEEYLAEVERLVSFLRTEGQSLLEPLEAARDRLSEELRFEDAAREHKQIERIQEMLRLRDGLARGIEHLSGVAVAASAANGSVELFFMLGGCWNGPVRFGFEVVEGRTVSMDHRLREAVGQIRADKCPAAIRQEHIALLARWFYSSWRDGDWIPFSDFEHLPYRRLVKAISRIAAPANTAETRIDS